MQLKRRSNVGSSQRGHCSCHHITWAAFPRSELCCPARQVTLPQSLDILTCKSVLLQERRQVCLAFQMSSQEKKKRTKIATGVSAIKYQILLQLGLLSLWDNMLTIFLYCISTHAKYRKLPYWTSENLVQSVPGKGKCVLRTLIVSDPHWTLWFLIKPWKRGGIQRVYILGKKLRRLLRFASVS